MIDDVRVRIVPRWTAAGMPFTEVLYSFMEDGREQHALTRLCYSIPDTPHSRAAQAQAFIQRQTRKKAAPG